ncbi:3'-5' exonuclease [Stutzerimonas xanthomarina]|uniref:3'-5' exonuclease n=1 Tax=Stutzerimonas xanthomarina TaxID=271420 RepID=UPI003AA7EDC6
MVLSRSRSTLSELTQKLSGALQRARHVKQANRVRLMTYHGSKGLEADVVFLVGGCEQLIIRSLMSIRLSVVVCFQTPSVCLTLP